MKTTTYSLENIKGNTLLLIFLVILRVAIGWHFLYEGVVKLLMPDWSAGFFLSQSRWIFSGLFNWMADTPAVLQVVDFLNIWGLILIGLGLMLGIFTRAASIAGIVLLGLYYIAVPPFIGMDFGVPQEGHYMIVNKNLVELLALCVLAVIPTGHYIGLARLLKILMPAPVRSCGKIPGDPEQVPIATYPQSSSPGFTRREMLMSLAILPVFGGFVYATLRKRGWVSYEERTLAQHIDGLSSATVKTFNYAKLNDLKEPVPHSKIGNMDLSRVLLGGNLIGGWAHARDLIYAAKLVKTYHTQEKVFETLVLAEKCGFNCLLLDGRMLSWMLSYHKNNIGNFKFLIQLPPLKDPSPEAYLDMVRLAIDNGASAFYMQGSEYWVRNNKFDTMVKALELGRSQGIPAGLGSHYVAPLRAAVEHDILPDFWMKTLHHHNYPTATLQHEKLPDPIYCPDPQEAIDFMNGRPEPWLAFKVLAAGRIRPEEGLRYAFSNGADFVCLGMYDFQVVENANTICNILSSDLQRTRNWMA